MADNVTFQSATPATPSAGTIVSADEVTGSGAKVQRVKLAYSADGSETHVTADADGLLVNLGANNDVTVTGTVAATQSGTWTVAVSGTVVVADGGGSITVDGTVSVSGLVPGTGATSLGKAEDAAAGDGDTGVMMLAVRKDVAATTVGADGDYHPLEVDANGRLHVIEPSASGAAASLAAIDDWDESDRAKVNLIVGQAGVAAGAGAVGATVQRVTLASDDPAVTALQVIDDWDNAASDGASVSGDVAHDAADAGEPVKIGAKATAGQSGATMVAAGDRTDLAADIDGVQIVRPVSLSDVLSEAISNTDGASTACSTFGAASGKKNVITCIHIFRDDAGTTPIRVDFRDGTGGSVIYRAVIPAGGGAVIGTGAAPIVKQPTANTALAYDVSAATSTVYINLTGYQTKA